MFPYLNRVQPKGRPEQYRTFQIAAPQSTHFRRASCSEVECRSTREGWMTPVDETTELGQAQAHYIRTDSGRSFREDRDDAGRTIFTFGPGQRCFVEHQVRIARPEIYLVREGDWRGNPRGTRPYRHTKPEHWREQLAENQDALRREIEKG